MGKGPFGIPDLTELNETLGIVATRGMDKGSTVGTKATGAGSPTPVHEVEGGLAGAAVLGATAPALLGTEEGAVAGAGGGAAAGAKTAAGDAAKAGSSALTKAALAGGLAVGVGELAKAYGVRVLEIVGGGALILYGLITVARGGTPPSLKALKP